MVNFENISSPFQSLNHVRGNEGGCLTNYTLFLFTDHLGLSQKKGLQICFRPASLATAWWQIRLLFPALFSPNWA